MIKLWWAGAIYFITDGTYFMMIKTDDQRIQYFFASLRTKDIMIRYKVRL